MPTSRAALASTITLLTAAIGCSSPTMPTPAQPGTEPAGTATITLADQAPVSTNDVSCQLAQRLSIIETGDAETGTSMLISDTGKLVVETVSLRNLGGFTGSLNAGLGDGDAATVAMVGRTFRVSGKAEGFDTAKPSFTTTVPFTIAVSC